jgi:hypothetical protein
LKLILVWLKLAPGSVDYCREPSQVKVNGGGQECPPHTV